MGTGFGFLVHNRRVHSHSLGYRDHRDRATNNPRPKCRVGALDVLKQFSIDLSDSATFYFLIDLAKKSTEEGVKHLKAAQ
jgi:hypothetical protein